MTIKTALLVCVQLLIIQSISVQCIGVLSGLGYGRLGYDNFGYGKPFAAGAASLTASNGPGLAVSSVSPLIPSGVSVLSENVYEGTLCVGGALPFLGTIALEGALPTVGAGSIAYGCGDGAVGITAEDGYEFAGPRTLGFGYGGIAEPNGYGLAGPLGYRGGYRGFGYGTFF